MVKISKIIIIALILIFTIISSTYAISDPSVYRPGNPTGYNNFYKKAGIILGTVRNIGAIVSVIGIAILGLRYMLGSVEQKANYKETMFPFIIGIALTVGMTTIIIIVQKVAETMNV